MFSDVVLGSYTIEVDPSTVPSNMVLTFDPDGAADMVAAVVAGHCDSSYALDFGFQDEANLPRTGFAIGSFVWGAMLLLLLGGALLLVGDWRRRGAGQAPADRLSPPT